ncbi:hypothetical protein [Aureimonas psammosilenae]|uniref:hypothetical protein n=1 Tax=Aureimonas psammosilenae TaxID=2495496 RepID=UPI0012610CC1|nr:hypothetical protein [Aureimonas psammosilenae]
MASPEDDTTRRSPAIPGMTMNEDAVIGGDAPDDPAPEEDDGDVSAPFDAEDGPLAVTDDDTLGVDEDDDDEREQGATEADR